MRKNFFNFLNKNSNKIFNLSSPFIEKAIYESCKIKKHVVEKDEKEKGLRKILNFGHTLGHAIESYLLENQNKNSLLHGEAIAIGMILESYISKEKKLILMALNKNPHSINKPHTHRANNNASVKIKKFRHDQRNKLL